MKKIFLDNNSTTIVDPDIISEVVELMKIPLNPSSTHFYGRKARGLVEDSRINILRSINALDNNYDLIFTSCGTEANNLLLNSYKDRLLLLPKTEHSSVINCKRFFDKYFYLDVDKDGIINFKKLERLLEEHQDKKILVSIMLANNETGVIQNIPKIKKLLNNYNAILHCDMSQAYGKIEINNKLFDCDFITISSHKINALIGCAALIYKKQYSIFPTLWGGGQEKNKRAGTENVLSIHSLGMVAKKINQKISQYNSLSVIRDNMEKDILSECKEATIVAKNVTRLPNTSCIMMPDVATELQLIKFDLAGIAVSAGSACSSGKVETSYVLQAMGYKQKQTSTAIRVSLGINNSIKEIDYFIKIWKQIYKNQTIKNLSILK